MKKHLLFVCTAIFLSIPFTAHTNTILDGTSEADHSVAIATDSNGNIYMSGQTNGSIGDGTNSGYNDAYLSKYDSNKVRLWTK